MAVYKGSLAGWGYEVHKKCNFQCQYCGFDGRSFPNWFQLSVEHIVPRTDDASNLVSVCNSCNSITSRMKFTANQSREEIFEIKKQRVKERHDEFFDFWLENVAQSYREKTLD